MDRQEDAAGWFGGITVRGFRGGPHDCSRWEKPAPAARSWRPPPLMMERASTGMPLLAKATIFDQREAPRNGDDTICQPEAHGDRALPHAPLYPGS